jgi:hypothetical protein
MKERALKWVVMAVLCFVNVASLHACKTCNGEMIDLAQKFYVKLHQVNFSNDKIYIHVEDFVYETPAIFSDVNGYYIEKVANTNDCAWYEWQCRWSDCGACNLKGVDFKCRGCKRPMEWR